MSESMNHPTLKSTHGHSIDALAITYREVTSLKPHKRNARTHSKRQIRQIADSIKSFGFINPVLVDAGGQIVAGHGRLEAAKLLGMTSVPTIMLEAMTGEQRRAYAIADNRLAELAGWDKQMLQIELGELSVEFPDLDLTVTGFEKAALDLIILGGHTNSTDSKCETSPEVDRVVSQPGDIWQLGPHRLLCGDTRYADNDAAKVDRVIADVEVGPKFVDEIVRRFERLAGIKARHVVTLRDLR